VAVAKAAGGARSSTPRARRVSAELGVDLTRLDGSGKGGRIRERDVRAAAGSNNHETPASPVAPGSSDVVISIMRRTIADRMMQSLANTAPVTLTTRIDATNLVALRNQFKSSKSDALVPAYTDIVAKLAATAIARFPAITGQWKGDRIIIPGRINIGIAVDTEYGLLVPVIPDVPRLSLAQVARTSRSLIDSAHARKLKPDALSGGVFTITNLGGFGIDAFTPIINAPETAILGLGAIRHEPAVVDGKNITIRDQMTLSLTFDHRVLDGAPAARFLQALAQGLENPIVWLLDVPVAELER
jgi:pyruvate dehydrogenase E2 component (dihydrolipoamide acetyltransferase)